ncbi:MAG: hypothetical protein L0241_10725 [Planctomycetia bacterium]|nr:hypothetical protein [Planctomycetia bacterium]
MSALLRSLAVVAGLLMCSAGVVSQDKDQVDNPFYKFWSKSKVGSSVTLKETTKLTPPAGGGDAGVEVKLIEHKLIELTAEKAVVETVVTEGELFGFVQSAPTKHIYPAKMSKEVLDELLKETGVKAEDATLKVGNKDMKVKYLTGTMKQGADDEVEFKFWLSEEVPGQIVKRVRIAKVKGMAVAETTIELVKFDKK